MAEIDKFIGGLMAELLDSVDELIGEMMLDPRTSVEFAVPLEAVKDTVTRMRYENEDLR